MQRYYSIFYYSFIYLYMFRPYDHQYMYVSGNYATDNGSVAIRILITAMDNLSDRFQ
jgi:hypothetical protein